MLSFLLGSTIITSILFVSLKMIKYNTIAINRLLNVFVSSLYVAFYDFIVRVFIFQFYEYFVDYQYHNMSLNEYLGYMLISVFPMLFFKGMKNLASVFSFFTYLFIYIPFINTLFVGGYSPSITYPYMFVFFISMCLFFYTDTICLFKKNFNHKPRLKFRTLEILTFSILLIVIALSINKIRFVNILTESDLMYEQRADNSLAGSSVGYLVSWLKNALIPILMVCYLRTQHYLKFTISFAAMIIVFMIDMSKITFLMAFIIAIVYFLYAKFQTAFLNYFAVFVMTSLMGISLGCYLFVDNETVFKIAAILLMRTLCIEGMELATYLNFFEVCHNHPYTYFTHIGIIGKITGAYPYSQPIGLVVTYDGPNANGCFWLMDGITGAGVLGCVFASFLFLIFKSVMNGMGTKYDIGLCVIILTFSIASLVNVSLFTAIMSCGYVLIYFIYMYFSLTPIYKNKI